eukprot:c283_g1_i2.p1 GENE.c283_g1_i2~~c283_g1_i2.p1  ORF type:complete len:228 (+),score=32.63 c283_g1_i2:379-1062(+)
MTGRESTEIEIYGMEGVPDDVLALREEEVLGVKRPKIESNGLASNNPSIVPQSVQPSPHPFHVPVSLPMQYPPVNIPSMPHMPHHPMFPAHHHMPHHPMFPYPMPGWGMLPPHQHNPGQAFPQHMPQPPPLFPVQPMVPQPVQQIQMPVQPPPPPPPPPPSTPPSADASAAPASDVRLVFNPDNEDSMEERRAESERYKFDESKIVKDLSRLDKNLEARLGRLLPMS